MQNANNEYIVEKSSLDDTVEVYKKKITASADIDSKEYRPKRVALAGSAKHRLQQTVSKPKSIPTKDDR